MATTAIPPSVHHRSHAEASSSSSSSSSSSRGTLRRSRQHNVAAPHSPLLKRALERTISIHTSMGSIAKPPIKRSVALAPAGPSSSARRLSITPSSPILKKSSAMPPSLNGSLNGSSSGNNTAGLNGSATLVITAPGSPSRSLSRSKSKGRMEKVVGFDLSSRELLKARKLAQKGFEEKTGKSWTLTRNKSQMELDLYDQEVKKHESRMLSKKQEELDKEISLQQSIDSRYSQITSLQKQLAEKELELATNQSFVEQTKKDIENAIKEQVMKGSAITDEKSSDVRMRLERQKKEIKRQMMNSEALDDPRRRVLQTQQEAEDLRTRITATKKEIAKIKHDASFERSAKTRMKAAKKAKEDERASGVVKQYAPVKQKVAKPVVAKSHMARMEAEKQRKLAKKGDNIGALRSSGGGAGKAPRTMHTLRTSGMIRQSSGLRSNSLINRALGSSGSRLSSSSSTKQ